jgi:hypothetical protein
MPEQMPDDDRPTRLIAKVLRALLEAGLFADYGEVKAAAHGRLRALRIRYRPADLDEAITWVTSNRALVEATREPPGTDRVRTDETFSLTRREAADLLAQIQQRCQVEAAADFDRLIKTIPATPGHRVIDIDAPVERDEVEHDRY